MLHRLRCPLGVTRLRHLNDDAIKLLQHRRVDYRLVRQLLCWLIPWPPLSNRALDRLRNIATDFIPRQSYELFIGVRICRVAGRNKLHELSDCTLREPENSSAAQIACTFLKFCAPALPSQRGASAAMGRRLSRFEEDDPILVEDVVGMDRNAMSG